MSEEKLLDYAIQLLTHIRITFSYLNTYKSLCTFHKQYYIAMNKAPLFFNITEYALVSALMMNLCKLYDGDKEALSFVKLKNICEQNQPLFPKYRKEKGMETDIPFSISGLLSQVEKDLKEASKSIEHLKIQRDKLWAHNDKKYFLNPKNVENTYPINWDEIEELLILANSFTNSVLVAFTNSIEAPWFNSPTACEDNVEIVLALMDMGLSMEE